MTTFNTSSNFTNIANAEWDSGLQLADRAYRAYGMEEASGTSFADIGIDGSDAVRNANFSQVAGVFDGTFATKGDGTNIGTIPWDAKFRNEFTWDMWLKPTSADLSATDVGIMGVWIAGSNNRFFFVRINSGDLIVAASIGTATESIVNITTPFTSDTNTHLRISYGATNGLVVSLNGNQAGSNSYIGDLNNYGSAIDLYNINGLSFSKFTGAIADLRFYDSVMPSSYTVPTEYYKTTGMALANDSGKLFMDAGSGYEWDNETFTEITSGTITIEYQYADYAEAQSWATASDVNSNAGWNGTWLSLAELQAEDNTSKPYRYLKIKITDYGSLTSLTGDISEVDLTPPTAVSGVANIALGTTDFDLITTCDNGTDSGGSGFAGTNFEIEVSGVSYYQQNDGSFSDDETFSNLLLKGDAEEHIIVYALEYGSIPTRFRLNSWDEAGNVARGDWTSFSQPTDADNIISSAGGNYDDSNLIPSNVKLSVTYGVDETGTYDPVQTPPAQPTLSLEDDGDGTTVIATVSGSDIGTTNTIYTAPYGSTVWTEQGSRTDDGDVTLTLDSGSYWSYCESELDSCSSRSNIAIVHVSDIDDAAIVDIAEFIKDEINNSEISDVAERNYIQHERMEKILGTEIWVQPNEHRIERATRSQDQHEYDIDVSIFKRCKTTSETDDLVLLSEQVYELLRTLEINGSSPSVVTIPTMFSPDDLLERNLFAAVITVTVKDIS